jgi:hypothetical protein
MLLDFLKPLTAQRGPFVTVTLDVSAIDSASTDQPLKRWQAQRQDLARAGVPPATLAHLDERAAESSGRGGENTRVVCATPDHVALDIVVPGRPLQDESAFSAVPHLMPLVRLMARAQPYVVARVNRRRSDISVVGMTGRGREHKVEGDHDVIHRVPGGGWSQRRWQTRAEDSWDQNARSVAGELDSIVRTSAPDLVLLEGDELAVSDVMDHLGSKTAERAVRLDTGGRAAGAGSAAERRAVADALQHHRDEVRAELLYEFAARMGGDDAPRAAVEGLDDVVSALQQGKVEHLLIHDDPASLLDLWVGQSPGSVGTTRDGALDSSGTTNGQPPQRDRADAVLVWALAGSGGAVTLLEAGDAWPRQGVGALLRW